MARVCSWCGLPDTDWLTSVEPLGTALKPAFEPIVVARKPLSGTVAGNVLRWGTGALNIDATRVGYQSEEDKANARPASLPKAHAGFGDAFANGDRSHHDPVARQNAAGRWPTNVVLDEAAAGELDRVGPHTKDGVAVQRNGGGQALFGGIADGTNTVGARDDAGYGGEGGPSRFFPVFRYQAKAPARERPSYVKGDGTKVAHPTVKPVPLLRWLVRLATPPGGVILDPFAGSGTTVEAALLEGFRVIGVEREADYLPLIAQRIDRARAPQAGPAPKRPAAPPPGAELSLFDTEETA